MSLRRWMLAALLAGLAWAAPAVAVVLPVGSTSAADLIFEVDLTGATPPPPYIGWNIVGHSTGGGAGDHVVVDVFADPGGANFLFSTGWAAVSGAGDLATSVLPGMEDGVLSLGVRATGGSIELTGLSMRMLAATGAFATATLVSTVPEPADMALVAVALLGVIATLRLRRARVGG